MARPSAKARLQEIERYREQVLSQPLAKGISPDEVRDYLATLPPGRYPKVAYSKPRFAPLTQPRGGFPLFEAQYRLTQELDAAGADFIPLTIDSCTRHNQYETAEQLLRRSENEGKNYLNGYPLVSHGYALTRELYSVAIAAGIVEIEGGGICYCFPYSEAFPLDRSLLYWQYVDRLCAVNSTEDAPIHRESFGPLSATLVPPAIVVAIQIIEALLAAEQGVTSFAVSFGQTGSVIQDIATAHILKTLTRDYLQMFGFESMQSYLVYHQWMGRFPPQRAKAAALIASSSVIGSMISADKIVVKTVDEALGIPDWSTNVDAVDMVKYICRTFPCPQPLTSPLIEREIALIESETRSILQTIFSMLGDVFWHSVLQAFQFGFVDIPFSPHADNANKLISMRDGNGSIRICDRGNVPICDEDVEQERVLLQSRLASNGDSEQMYERLLSDINIMV